MTDAEPAEALVYVTLEQSGVATQPLALNYEILNMNNGYWFLNAFLQAAKRKQARRLRNDNLGNPIVITLTHEGATATLTISKTFWDYAGNREKCVEMMRVAIETAKNPFLSKAGND
jgi:hypothetical protein